MALNNYKENNLFKLITKTLNSNNIKISDFYFDYFDINKFNSFTGHYIKNKKYISLIHLNISSLNKHNTELLLLLNELIVKFDFIILTEIRSNNISFFNNIISNYSFYYKLSKTSQFGGVGVFIRNDQNIIVSTRTDIDININGVENIWFEINYLGLHGIIAGIYRHPSFKIEPFTQEYYNILSSLSLNNYDFTMIAGDFNINLLYYREHRKIDEFINTNLLFNYYPSIIAPTRISKHSETLIDNIFYNTKLTNNFNIFSGNLLVHISDHLPNFIILSKDNTITNNKSNSNNNDRLTPYRDYSNKNIAKFYNLLKEQNWELIEKYSINESYDSFITILNCAINQTLPFKKTKKPTDKYWYNSKIKHMLKQKNQLYKKFINNRSFVNERNFKLFNNLYKKTIFETKQSYHLQTLIEGKNNPKKIWQHINSIYNISNNPKNNNNLINYIQSNNNKITNSIDMANLFNTFFCNNCNAIQAPICYKFSHNNSTYTQVNTIAYTDITSTELINIISKISIHKTAGPDSISPRIIKNNIYIIKPLLYIFNRCLNEGFYPSSLKIAKVIPIYKKNERSIISNYRPISLLNIIDKIFEKCINSRLLSFLEKYKIINNFQFGFRPYYSTKYALIEIIDLIKIETNFNNNIGLGIFIDLKQAFDSIDHTILLNKLYNYGIRGPLNLLLKSYLQNRKQFVFCNKEISKTETVNQGVPQGSVLGPVLFNIFINDIFEIDKTIVTRAFADDTNFFIFDENLENLTIKANLFLKKLKAYLDNNKLTLNIEKTKYMLFYKYKSPLTYPSNISIKYNEIKIDEVNHIKYLGLIIDHKLNFKEHILYTNDKLKKYIGILYKIRPYVTKKILKNLYFAFIHSNLLYGIEVYGSAINRNLNIINKTNRNLLLICQKHKIKNYNSNISTQKLYSKFNTMSLKKLYIFQILLITHKIIYQSKKIPEIYKNYLNITNINDRTNNITTKLPLTKNSTVVKTYIYLAVKSWNNLPNYLKTIKSYINFKYKLKNYILNTTFSSL